MSLPIRWQRGYQGAAACLLASLAACAPSDGGPSGGRSAAAIPLDTTWQLLRLRGEPALTAHRPSLAWEADGRIHGSTGCNRYFGEWSGLPDQLQIGPLGMTRMACLGEGAARQERAFAEALQASRRLRHAGAHLVLEDGSGQELLRFDRTAP